MLATVEIRFHGQTIHSEAIEIREGLINETAILWRISGTPFEVYATFVSTAQATHDGAIREAQQEAGRNGATLLAPGAE